MPISTLETKLQRLDLSANVFRHENLLFIVCLALTIRLRKAHRVIGLSLGLLWGFQLLSGLLLVFRWELDDLSINSPRSQVNFGTIERQALYYVQEHPKIDRIAEIWVSGTADNRFDVYFDSNSASHQVVARVDGVGNVLRISDGEATVGSFFDTLKSLHYSLLSGATGILIIALSGIFLSANIVVGWILLRRRAKSSRVPKGPIRGRQRLLYWHRQIGTLVAIPLLLIVGAGVVLSVQELWPAKSSSLAQQTSLPCPAHCESDIGLASAISIAIETAGQASFSGAKYPDDEKNFYEVRLRMQQEHLRVYGRSTVFVNAANGTVLAFENATQSSLARRALDAVYPLHTGQMFGVVGRVVSVLVAVAALTIVAIGFALWLRDRRQRAKPFGRDVTLYPSSSCCQDHV